MRENEGGEIGRGGLIGHNTWKRKGREMEEEVKEKEKGKLQEGKSQSQKGGER